MSSKVKRLAVPSFDLIAVRFQSKSAKKDIIFVLVPGGGGSTKSGVKNQIQIGKLHENNDVRFDSKFCTDAEGADKLSLCCSLSSGEIAGTSLVCGAFDDKCVVYVVTCTEGDEGLDFKPICTFTADYSSDLPTVNCSAFVPGGDTLITGGQDGDIRVWKLTNKEDTGAWSVSQVNVLKGHSGPIMSLVVHPQNPAKWVASASKDGTCKMWNYTVNGNDDAASDASKASSKPPLLTSIDGKQTVLNNCDTSKTPNAANATFECRGCCFSPNGHEMYMLMCPRKGNATVIRWLLEVSKPSAEAGANAKLEITPRLLHIEVVSKFPCTKLRINESGNQLAVGTSDGNIVVLNTFGSAKSSNSEENDNGKSNLGACVMRITMTKENCHDLPVTGISFLPLIRSAVSGKRRKQLPSVVLSCSADNKFVTTVVPSGQDFLTSHHNLFWLIFVFLIVIVAVLLNHYHEEQTHWFHF